MRRKPVKKTRLSRSFLDKLVFIIFMLGPAMDIVTSLMSNNDLVTPGIIVRTVFIFYAIFYLIYIDKARRKLNLVLLGILFILSLAIFIMNFEFITNLNFQIISYIFKFIFLCIGLIFFSSWGATRSPLNIYLFRIPSLIIITFFFIALATGTAYHTYPHGGDGYSGWISSANELSTLLCCIYPFSLFNAFKKDGHKKLPAKILDLVIVVSLSAIMLILGTKAALLGYLMTASAYFIYRIITIKVNRFSFTLILVPILLIATAISWNYLPAVITTGRRIDKIESVNTNNDKERNNNTAINLTQNKSDATQSKTSTTTSKTIDLSKPESTELKSTTSDIIWNGRDDFARTLNELRAADITTNKTAVFLFGKFYTKDNKVIIIERDFSDILNLFGLFSLIFVITLIAPTFLLAIIRFFATIKKPSNHFLFVTICSAGIALSAAFICGHTILSPSVASFFVITVALLLRNPTNSKRTVVFVASAGGHLTQIMMLSPIFKKYNSYLITEKTPIKIAANIPVKFVLYCSRKQPIPYFFKSIINICKSFYLFATINPDVIITTGTHTAAPLCLLGWIFRRKVIYIESFAKNSSPTLAGHLLYPFVDVFIVQWKNMKKFYPKAKYFGGIY